MRITLLAMAAMAVLSTASARTYTVGGPRGAWDLSTDYGTWVSDMKFLAGDRIVFKYSPQAHDVLKVSKADYDSCNTTNPITTFNSGNDIVTLTDTSTRYFICGFPGHCSTTGTGGMKVKIDVVSGSSSPSSPAPASGPNAPPPQVLSAATSVKVTAGLGLVVMLAGLMA